MSEWIHGGGRLLDPGGSTVDDIGLCAFTVKSPPNPESSHAKKAPQVIITMSEEAD